MSEAEPPLTGPYNPTWQRRRQVSFLTLGWCGIVFPVVALFVPDGSSKIHTIWALTALGGLVLTYYLMGPTWQAWILGRVAAAIVEKDKRENADVSGAAYEEGVL